MRSMESRGTIGARLREARKAAGLSLEAVGRHVGVTAQAVQQWEKDKSIPDAERLSRVAEVLKCNLTWVLTGRDRREQIENLSQLALRGRQVPRYGFGDVIERVQPVAFVTAHFPCSDRSFSIVIEDASCAPEFAPGDSVIIDPAIKPVPGDMVLAVVRGEALFRRFKVLARAPASYALEPLNPLWAVDTVDDLTAVLGVMSEHTRPRRV